MTERNWKKNTGKMPVDGDQMVAVKYRNGTWCNMEAKWFDWDLFEGASCITHWDYEPPRPAEEAVQAVQAPNHDRETILDTAKEYITNDRAQTHGQDAEDSFSVIAQYWSNHLDVPVSASDVCTMMCLLKLARIKSNPKHTDSWIDVCGYAALGGEIND